MAWPSANLGNLFYTSLRKGDSHLKDNSLTSTIPGLTPTHAISPSHTRPWPVCGSLLSTACFCTLTCPYPVTPLPTGSGYFEPTFSLIISQHFSNLVHSTHTYLPMKMEQTEWSERRHLKFIRRGITPKKAYNIQNTAKVWNLNFVVCLLAGCWWNSVIQYCNSLQVNLINFTLLLNCSTACINMWPGKNVT